MRSFHGIYDVEGVDIEVQGLESPEIYRLRSEDRHSYVILLGEFVVFLERIDVDTKTPHVLNGRVLQFLSRDLGLFIAPRRIDAVLVLSYQVNIEPSP